MPRFKHNKNFKRQRVDSGSEFYFPLVNTGGLTAPGFNNLGPWNSLALPTNHDDEVAFFHDPRYEDIQDSGQDPYFHKSRADRIFNEAKMQTNSGVVGQYIFGAKSAIFPSIDESRVGTYHVDRAKKWLDRARRDVIIASTGQNPIISDLVKERAHHKRRHTFEHFRRMVAGGPRSRRPIPEEPHRDPPNVIPDDDDMNGIPTPTTAPPTAGGTTNIASRLGKNETAIDPFGSIFRKPFHRTVTVSMPYQQHGTFAATLDTPNAYALTYRLNSIYDIQSNDFSFTAVTSGAPTADTSDASPQTAMYRSYWADLYKYWTVVAAKYTLMVWLEDAPTSGQGNERKGVTVFQYEHGRQGPPLYTSTGPNVLVPGFYREQHPNMKESKTLTAKNAYTDRIGWDDKIEFTGYYTPGAIDHQVIEDEYAQTWHKVTEVPPTEEMVTFVFQKPDLLLGLSVDLKYCFDCEYIVQWKDLAWKHDYVTPDSGIDAIANYTSTMSTPQAPTSA